MKIHQKYPKKIHTTTKNITNQEKFKTGMLKSSLCYYRDAYRDVLIKGTIIVTIEDIAVRKNKV